MEKVAPKVKEASMAKDNLDREARLAEALRANLRRRKAQSREQTSPQDAAAGSAPDPTTAPSQS
jgi:hypothetical protein